MSEQEKHLTEAEKQIRRLEELRSKMEQSSKTSAEKAYFPPKTLADQTADKLRAMRDESKKPVRARRAPKIEGKQKSSKLTHLQIRVLEQLLSQDKRLRGSAVTRIALNRFLNLENSAEENELESRISEILRQFKIQS